MTNDITITGNNEIMIVDAQGRDLTTTSEGSFVGTVFSITRTIKSISDTWGNWTQKLQSVNTHDYSEVVATLDAFDAFVMEQGDSLRQQIVNSCQPSNDMERAAFIVAILKAFPNLGKDNKIVVMASIRELLNDLKPTRAVLAISYKRLLEKFVGYPPTTVGAITTELKQVAEIQDVLGDYSGSAFGYASYLRQNLPDAQEQRRLEEERRQEEEQAKARKQARAKAEKDFHTTMLWVSEMIAKIIANENNRTPQKQLELIDRVNNELQRARHVLEKCSRV
jgi:hypothetical protein